MNELIGWWVYLDPSYLDPNSRNQIEYHSLRFVEFDNADGNIEKLAECSDLSVSSIKGWVKLGKLVKNRS